MKTTRVVRVGLVGLSTVLLLFACAVFAVRCSIQAGLDRFYSVAQAAHSRPGDNVAALLEYAQSPEHSWRERNHAVWALGQTRDKRALRILQHFYTGAACDHDHGLCQGELGKAIELCRGETPNLLLIRAPRTKTP